MKSFAPPEPERADAVEILLQISKRDEGTLTIRPDPLRVLEIIKPLTMTIDDLVTYWYSHSFPIKPVKKIDLTLPCHTLPTNFVNSKFFSHKACNIEVMIPWFQVILNTAARVMHCAFPITNDTNFIVPQPSENDLDQQLLRHLLWHWEATHSTSLVFVYQTPYTLNERDMQDFVQCYSLPPFQRDSENEYSLNRYRLWAKVWDACASNRSHYFVLSSYNQWVFGIFSRSMKTAFVSRVYSYMSDSPTILQLLVYWLASSSNGTIQGTFDIPHVPESTLPPLSEDCEMDAVHESTGPCRPPLWQGHGEPGQDADVDLRSILSGEGSLHSTYDKTVLQNPDVKNWVEKSDLTTRRAIDEDDFVFLPRAAPRRADDEFIINELQGEWMV